MLLTMAGNEVATGWQHGGNGMSAGAGGAFGCETYAKRLVCDGALAANLKCDACHRQDRPCLLVLYIPIAGRGHLVARGLLARGSLANASRTMHRAPR